MHTMEAVKLSFTKPRPPSPPNLSDVDVLYRLILCTCRDRARDAIAATGRASGKAIHERSHIDTYARVHPVTGQPTPCNTCMRRDGTERNKFRTVGYVT